jgi:hypothetical protein
VTRTGGRSYGNYLCKHKEGLVDTEDTWGYFSKDMTIAIKKYQEFVENI